MRCLQLKSSKEADPFNHLYPKCLLLNVVLSVGTLTVGGVGSAVRLSGAPVQEADHPEGYTQADPHQQER